MQDTALKMTQKLAKLSYRDIDLLSNATTKEKAIIIALSMYYQLRQFHPSKQFIKN